MRSTGMLPLLLVNSAERSRSPACMVPLGCVMGADPDAGSRCRHCPLSDHQPHFCHIMAIIWQNRPFLPTSASAQPAQNWPICQIVDFCLSLNTCFTLFLIIMRYSALEPDMKQQRRTVVLLLRFRTIHPTPACRKYFTYAKVARIANLSYNSV